MNKCMTLSISSWRWGSYPDQPASERESIITDSMNEAGTPLNEINYLGPLVRIAPAIIDDAINHGMGYLFSIEETGCSLISTERVNNITLLTHLHSQYNINMAP